MDDYSDIVDWENFSKYLEKFHNAEPFKYVFIENFFQRDFYEKLFQNIPEIDESWDKPITITKTQNFKSINNFDNDNTLSTEWKKFIKYINTEEFAEKFREFSKIPVTNLRGSQFIYATKDCFQNPHYHDKGPSTLVCLFYFNKNWKKGDPGGTYIASKEEESSIIFEPYNLDNTMVLFHDGPLAIHGSRLIKKDVIRKAFQIVLEEYSPEFGWTGDQKRAELIEL